MKLLINEENYGIGGSKNFIKYNSLNFDYFCSI